MISREQFKHLKKYKWCKGIDQDTDESLIINVDYYSKCEVSNAR